MDALFDLPSEYKDLRASVRSLAENEIAPHAQAVDEITVSPKKRLMRYKKLV